MYPEMHKEKSGVTKAYLKQKKKAQRDKVGVKGKVGGGKHQP